MPERHTIPSGKAYVYKRPNSSLWRCSTYLAGKNRRTSTRLEAQAKLLKNITRPGRFHLLSRAGALMTGKKASRSQGDREDWYLKLRGKLRFGETKSKRTFRDASEQYLREYDIIDVE